MKHIAANIQHLLESAANRVDEQLGQRIEYRTSFHQEYSDTTNSVVELRNAMTETASQQRKNQRR